MYTVAKYTLVACKRATDIENQDTNVRCESRENAQRRSLHINKISRHVKSRDAAFADLNGRFAYCTTLF